MDHNKTKKISQFWEWFFKNCKDFGVNFDNAILLAELDDRISKLGNFSWEIGPGREKDNALVISPNGDADLLEETKEIIKKARNCSGWEYYYAKPPKKWELVFDFETSNETFIEVNASEWQYVLLQYEDGMFEIIIRATNLNGLNETDKLTAAEITLDGVLGEELRMQAICEIDVVEEFEEIYKGKASNIKSLPDHVRENERK
jgi:hypothetical protein